MLDPVLADSKTGEIETFDVAKVSKKQASDVSVEQLGKSAKLPWETDGQQWHIVDRLSHDGKRCKWEGAALQYVLDLLSKDDRLAPVNWNHRSTVEVKASSGIGWFLHARTGHEWLMSLCFRVKKNTFETKALDAALGLTPIDDVEEIHYYSQSPRVKARNLKQPWQEVTIKVWKKEEIDTPAFRKILATAVDAHIAQAQKDKANPDDLTPWKQLGRKWHLMKKGLPKNGRVPWDFAALEQLLPIVEKAFDGSTVDYGIRSKINWKSADNKPVAEIHTKKMDGVHLIVFKPKDSVTIGSIAHLGSDQEIKHSRNGLDAVRIRFDQPSQVVAKEIESLIL